MFTGCDQDGVFGAVFSLTVFRKGVQSGVFTACVQDGVFREVSSLPVFRMVCPEWCVHCLCSGQGVQSAVFIGCVQDGVLPGPAVGQEGSDRGRGEERRV